MTSSPHSSPPVPRCNPLFLRTSSMFVVVAFCSCFVSKKGKNKKNQRSGWTHYEEWLQRTKAKRVLCGRQIKCQRNCHSLKQLWKLNVQIKIISVCMPSYLTKSDFWEAGVQIFVIIQVECTSIWLRDQQFILNCRCSNSFFMLLFKTGLK